jgi:hypothetical protein
VTTTIDFHPTIDVLSEQPRQLQPADRSFEGLLRHFPGLAEAEAVCFTGSLAAGWGNQFSDIDIYAFSDVELKLPVDETMETWPGCDPSGLRWHNWMGRYGDSRVDLQVWPTAALSTALAPCIEGEPEFFTVQGAIPDFVYRFSIGIALKDEEFFERGLALIQGSSYRRSLARSLKIEAENALTDVAGQLDKDDFTTARLSAAKAAADVADSALVLVGELCRSRKWIHHRLEARPDCGITAAEYRHEVMSGPLPGENDRASAVRVARWAQAHLVRIERATLSVGA